MKNPSKKKGYWLEDPFKSFINGLYGYESTFRDVRKFSIEIDRASDNLFFEGRDSDQKCFFIEHPDARVTRDLNEYFLNDFGYRRDKLYGQFGSLVGFLSGVMQSLVLYGQCYYAVDWEEREIEKRMYLLPIALRYLNSATISVIKNELGVIKEYKQKYSPFSRIDDDDETRKFSFRPYEVFYTVYPLDKEHPVKTSMGLLKPILKFYDFMLKDSEARAYTQNHRLDLETARTQRYSEQKRIHGLARAKVRKNFHYLIDVDDITITEYYYIFWITRYKKELNLARQYFVEEFNNQILKPLARKNKLKSKPKLKLKGFMTNEEIDRFFENYRNKKINADEFINKVVNSGELL